MLRLVVGLLSLVALAFVVAEFFIAFLLPRRVNRDPAIARGVLRILWIPWRAISGLLPRDAADTMLGIFGPLGLLAILLLLSSGAIVSFGGVHWAVSTRLGGTQPADFGNDLYFSAGTFFSANACRNTGRRARQAASDPRSHDGPGLPGRRQGYLPALYQAFSRWETAVSRLDPRAGSPPSVGRLLERTGQRGGWSELDEYLLEWENCTADLMETHPPVLSDHRLLPVSARRAELAGGAYHGHRRVRVRGRLRAGGLDRGRRADLPDRAPCARRPRPHVQHLPARARPRAEGA
jgi:hypothetical protein